jgi:glycosyltransferase involved in cell wall biosynthesis
MRTVLVYRDDILPRSEIAFMRRQYLAFSELHPLWVGRRVRPWIEPAAFPPVAVLDGWAGLRFKLAGAVPAPVLAELRALAPVCVHAQFGRGGALALPLAERLGVPLAVTFHGGDVYKAAHYRLVPPALFRLRMARLRAYAALFVCVSAAVRRRLLERGFPAERAEVIHIGTDRIDPAPRDTPGEGVLFAGRFVEMKGIDVLADAIRLLRARGSAERFVLIGDGAERPRIARLLAGVGGVELRGWQGPDDVRSAMRAARLVVVPSVVARSGEAEGLPSVAVEAMGIGTPVVASTDAGLEGVVQDGVTGLVFRSRDAAALADAIAALSSAPDRAMALGEAARRLAEQEFDATRQSRRLEAALARMVEEAASKPAGRR